MNNTASKKTVSVYWLVCNSENRLAEHFGRPGYEGSLPFLVDSAQADLLSGGQPVNLTEAELLMGLLCGLPDMEYLSYLPVVFGQKQILEAWLERLEVGFGWLNREEMITDTVRFSLSRFGRLQAALILKNHLFSRGFNMEIFLARAALIWNEALLNRRTELLKELLDTISGFSAEIRKSSRDGWISLVHLALLSFFGKKGPAEEGEFTEKLMERITDPHHRMLAGWLQTCAALTLADLEKLGTAPPEYLENYNPDISGPAPGLPEYRRTRLQYPKHPIPNVLAYKYYAGASSGSAAYGVNESDLDALIEELLVQIERYYRLRPGGPFLIGVTMQKILEGNPKAGGILMALASEEINRRITLRMERQFR